MKNDYLRYSGKQRVHYSLLSRWSLPLAALAAVSGHAATLTWDANSSTAPNPSDGTGDWDSITSNWWNGTSNVPWPNTTGDTAVFGSGGTAGTVTLAGTINVGTINFNAGTTGTYTLTGGILNGLAAINNGQSGVTSSRINTDITRVGGLNINSGTAGSTLALDGAMNVSGQLFVSSNATVTLGGNTSNTLNDVRVLSSPGAAAGTLILAKTGGALAVTGNILLGGNYGSSGFLQLGASHQIADTSIVSIAPGGAYSHNASFSLMGFDETIGWIGGVQFRGHARLQNGGAAPSVLTLAGDTLSQTISNGGSNGSVTVQNGGAGTLSLVKNGTGTQVFNNANLNHTGTTTINNGVFSLTGSNHNSSSTILGGGTLNLTSSTANAAISGTSGGVTITGGNNSNFGGSNKTYSGDTVLSAASTSLTQTAANSLSANSIHNIGAGASLITGNLAGSVKALMGAGTVNLNGAAANLTLSDGSGQTFSGAITGTGALTKSGAGTQTLTNANNSYTGATTINGGELQLGGAGRLNSGAYAGNITNTATIRYSSSANQTLSGNISGAGGALIKDTGAGTLTLSGTNSYTGGTTVNAGSLIGTTAAALGANGGLTVADGATFAYQPTLAGALDVGSGALNLAGGSRIGTVLAGTASQSAITSSAAAATAGAITVDVRGVPGAAPTTGLNALITAASGLDGASYTLGSLYNLGSYTLSGLSASGTAVSINVASATPLADAWWKGGFSGGNDIWAITNGSTASNWASDAGGTDTSLTPGPGTTVRFSAAGATNQGAMVLGDNMSVAGVVVVDPSAITLNSDPYTLTTGAGGIVANNGSGTLTLNANLNSGAGGVTLDSGSGNVVLAGPVTLGAAQAWTNNRGVEWTVSVNVATAGFTLTSAGTGSTTFSGIVGGVGGLAKAGSGTTTLSGANTYTGATQVNLGTLALSGGSAIANTGAVTLADAAGAILQLNNSEQIGSLSGGGAVGGEVKLGANTLTTGDATTTTFAGVISGAGGSLTKVGAGTMILTGGNTYTGTTTVSAGVLRLGAAAPAVLGSFVMNGADGTYARMQQPGQFGPGVVGNLTSASGAWNRFELFGQSQTLAGITTGNTTTQGGGVIQNSETNGAAGANATLTLDGSGTYVYNGHLRDYGNTAAGTHKLNLIKNGAGTQTLQGTVVSYSGTTAVNAGTLKLVDTTVFKSAINNAATVELNAVTGFGLTSNGALSGNGIWNKTGAGILRFNGGQAITATGQINVQQGTLQNDNNLVNWSGSTAAIDISSGAILDLYADAIYAKVLTGSGIVQNNFGNSSGQSGTAVFYEKFVLGTGNGSGTFSGVIRNNSAGTAPAAGTAGGGIQLVKEGTGTQTLSGNNTFTGGTTVNNGTLIGTTTSALGTNSGLTVANGAKFSYEPPAAGTLNVGSGVLNFAGGSRIGTVLAGTASQSAITSSGAAVTAGSVTIDIRGFTGAAPAIGVNNLITAASGLNGATYTLGNIYSLTDHTLSSLTASPTAVSITVAAATPLSDAFWKGGLAAGDNVWSLSDGATATSNWATDVAGTATSLTPGAGATARFSATVAGNQGAMVLGAPVSIAGLVVSDAATIGLVADGNTLTLGTGGITVNSGAGAVTLAAPIALNGAQTWSNASANTLAFSGVISGSSTLTKTGSGMLLLSGANVNTGAVTVSAGTLKAGVASLDGLSGAFGKDSAVTLTDTAGAVLDITGFNTRIGSLAGGGATGGNVTLGAATLTVGVDNTGTSYSGVISGVGGGLTKAGTGRMDLAGSSANTHTGLTTVQNGILALNKSPGVAAIAGDVSFTAAAANTDMIALANNQFGANSVLYMTGAANFPRFHLLGTTQALAGIVGESNSVIQNNEQAESGVANSGNSTLILSGSGSYAYSGFLRNATGTLALTKNGGGTQTLSGANINYTGATSVTGGTLKIAQGTVFQSSAVSVGNNAVLEYNTAGGAASNTSTGIARTVAHTGTGTVRIIGTGFTAFSKGTGSVTFNMGAGSMFDVQSSEIQFGWNYNAFSSNLGGLNVADGAAYRNSDASFQFDALTGAGVVGNAYNTPVTLTLGVNGTQNNPTYGVTGNTALFSGQIKSGDTYNTVTTGALSLVKTGAGTQILSGNNTYTGTTQINQGTLIINGTHNATGLINVAAGATLGGSGTVGNVVVASDAILSPGNSAGKLTVNNLTLSPTSVLALELSTPDSFYNPASDFVTVVGTAELHGVINITPLAGFGSPVQGDRWLIMTYGNGLDDTGITIGSAPGGADRYVIDTSENGLVYINVVPEAGTGFLVALGLALLLRQSFRKVPVGALSRPQA